MNGIEIFIDESGDFGKFDERCPYYIITMVFHESEDNLFEEIQELEYRLAVLGFADHCIHSSPAIRAEEGYRGVDVKKRRKVLSNLLAFIHKGNLKYKCFFAKKGNGATEADILAALHAEIDPFVDAPERFESDFMVRQLGARTLTPEARAVLDAGRAIWRTYFERFGSFDYAIRERLKLNRADVGWYQVRNALKLYAESAEGHPTDFSAFEFAYKALGDKLRPKVYEYGFLRQ